MMSRAPWSLIGAAALVALLAALATLQYRWLGDVSQAERERMRAGLQTRASDFSEAFDRELSRTYVAFHVDGEALSADPGRVMADAYARWQATAAAPALIDALYLLEAGNRTEWSLARFDPARAAMERADWPPLLEQWRRRSQPHVPALPGMRPLLVPDPLDASIPALIVAVPAVTAVREGDRLEVFSKTVGPGRAIVIVLNADRLKTQVVEPLAAKYFGSGAASEYLVTVVRRDDPSQIVYASDPLAASIDARGADVTTPLFDLRMDELARSNAMPPLPRPEGANARMAITIVRRSSASADGPGSIGGPAFSQGAWLARIRYRSGPLETIVARSRRRNIAVGLGVLGLLAASFVLIIASAQRQRRLARQQMEFVAAVSHELRTPLAVIRSAGENLADGVVAADDQVKQYGSLIESEGRRLTDMVERVMEFAGIVSGRTIHARADVDLARAIGDAADGVRTEARERAISVTIDADPSLPLVAGDGEALRSALQNIIGNAVKYSPDGGRVSVRAEASGTLVRVTVADRGIGIDADDLPHIFKPFFRGRRASDAQIRGTGIGLSVVRHVVDAHHGAVRVDSRSGEGTTVVVELPVAAAAVQPAAPAPAPKKASA
jgi:signal transduction histidine kinase